MRIIPICLFPVLLAAQSIDYSGARQTIPWRQLDTEPGICKTGEIYRNTVTGNYRICTPDNVWTDWFASAATLAASGNVVAGGSIIPGLPARGLIAQYDFVKGANLATLYDKSGNGNHGTLGTGAAAPSWIMSGGLTFSGAQSVALALASSSPMTVITAGAPTTFGTTQIYAGSDQGNTYAGVVSGHWSSNADYSGSTQNDSTSTVSPAVVISTRGSNSFETWVNGVLMKTTAETAFPLAASFTTLGMSGTGTFPFGGNLYYFALYNRVLSDAEVLQAYNYVRGVLALRGLALTAKSAEIPGIIQAYGDSITNNQGASVTANGYSSLIGTAEGVAISQHAISGSQITTQIDNIYGTSVLSSTVSYMLTGYNDMRNYGTNATSQGTYSDTLRAGLAWLAIPEANKIRGTSGSVTYAVGSWSTSAAYGIGKNSASAGATAQVTLTGSVVYVGYIKLPGTSGTFTVSIDGSVAATVNSNQGVTDGNTRAWSAGLVRIGGLTYGSHTVLLTQVSGTLYFDWAAAGPWPVSSPQHAPAVYVGNCLRMTTAGYALASPYNAGSDTAVGQFNVIIAATVQQLAADGLAIKYIDVSSAYNPVTAGSPDNIHPGDAGHAAIANAFLNVMP